MTRISGLNYECRYEESAICIAAAVRGALVAISQSDVAL